MITANEIISLCIEHIYLLLIIDALSIILTYVSYKKEVDIVKQILLLISAGLSIVLLTCLFIYLIPIIKISFSG